MRYAVRKSIYLKKANERVYRKQDKVYLYFDKSFKQVCDEQYSFFERGSRNKPVVSYSNFGTKRSAVRSLPNGAKIKTVIEEVYLKR